ncbi:MAG: penicillin-binding protein 1C [Akkermansiaceae bacterium]
MPGDRKLPFRLLRSHTPPILPVFPRLVPFLFLLLLLPLIGPLPEKLREPPPPHPVLLDRHGNELTHFPRPDYFRHRPASLEEIPEHLIKATLAAEDKRFFSHPGIDYTAITRALSENLLTQRITSGASTITQQLIKISAPAKDRTLQTKFREMALARRLESRWDKEQILTAYLNRLDYGSHRQGCAEAARYFFDKPLADLSLAESALLAGLPQAPSRLNPRNNPDEALTRRNWILDRLQSEFDYPDDTISRAKTEPLQLASSSPDNPIPHLAHSLPPGARTSIDSRLQKVTENILREELASLSSKNVQQGALVVIENQTGEILALHGSSDFKSENGGQINGALSPRSAGSSLKPFTYALAFKKQNLFPGSIIADIPTPYRTEEGLDAPKNFDRRHHGPVSIRHALATSLNVAAMRMLNQLGGPQPLHELLTELGMKLPKSAAEYGLGLTIGNAEVSLLSLTNAYATLARLGEFRPCTFLHQDLQTTRTILSPESCYLVADILADNNARASAFGIQSSLRLPFPCSVKTGTSSDFRDNWCLGFTRDFTVGVWIGNFDNTPMAGISGITGAGPIFQKTMLTLHENHPPAFLARPENIESISVDERTGHYYPVTPPPNTPWHRTESCRSNHYPLAVSPADYDSQNRALLTSEYQEWFKSTENNKSHAFALTDLKPLTRLTLRSLTPLPNATYFLDPELPSSTNQLKLTANLSDVTWSSPTLKIKNNTATLTPGTHQITLSHSETRQTITCKIQVEEL